MIEAKLVVVGGETKTNEVNLRLPTIIGRGHEVNLTLPHALVSRRHCEIFERDGHLVVKDLGSLNGTFVNNTRIDEQILEPGQLLTLGTVTFRAVYTAGVVAGNAPASDRETLPADSNLQTVNEAIEFHEAGADASDETESQPVVSPDKDTVYDESKNTSDTDELDPLVPSSVPDPTKTVNAELQVAASPDQVVQTGLLPETGDPQLASAEAVEFDLEPEIGDEDSPSLDSIARKLPR